MNNNNSKTIVWDNIPEWAIFSLEYGIDEELFLPDEDKEMITKFIVENFPNGYTMSCLLYTSDAADELRGEDLDGRRLIKKKKKE